MNYRKWLTEDLQNLERLRFAILQQTEELATIEAEMTAIKATDYDKIPGRGNAQQDRYLTAVAKKDELQANLDLTRRKVADLDRLLAELPDDERLIVDRMFVHREKYAADNLSAELGYETAHIYRLKNQALAHLATLRHGAGFQT